MGFPAPRSARCGHWRWLLGCSLVVARPVLAELPTPAQVWSLLEQEGSSAVYQLGTTRAHYDQHRLRIEQQDDRVVLPWDDFDIGRADAVHFAQPRSTAIALNLIDDADPSVILGQLTADGQIYLYNRNGFLFGAESVVNVHSLVASALEITEETFLRGITKVFDDNQGAAFEGAGAYYRLDAEGNPVPIAVQVAEGAAITAKANGRVILTAPEVINAGSIRVGLQGQIILAATRDKLYLQEADRDGHPFAGLLVEVETGGRVANLGQLSVEQGNVTLVGFAVEQAGRINATTAVDVNGAVRLLAREDQGVNGTALIAQRTERTSALDDGLGLHARVELAPGGHISVLPDTDSERTAVGEQPQPESYVELFARTLVLDAGSLIEAPSGRVDLVATTNPRNPDNSASGEIHLASGSRIDLSGYDELVLPASRAVVELDLRSFELRDVPLQKGGVLDGATVRVDVRKGTRMADISGALAKVERTVAERSTEGGQLNLVAGDAFIFDAGAQIDLSGGSIRYEAGPIDTTKLLLNGRFVDIGDADPNVRYDALWGQVVESDANFGVTRSLPIAGPVGMRAVQPASRAGADAGGLGLSASRMLGGGTLVAETWVGTAQRRLDARPQGGQYRFELGGAAGIESGVEVDAENRFDVSAMSSWNIGVFGLTTAGDLWVDEQVDWVLPVGAEVALEGGEVHFGGDLRAPGGQVSVTAEASSVASGDLWIEPGATIDVSGAWTNDHAAPEGALLDGAVVLDGGAIELTATGTLALHRSAGLFANAGAWLQRDGSVEGGSGGRVAAGVTGSATALGDLRLGARMEAFGFERGGTLALTAPGFVFGAEAPVGSDPQPVVWFENADFQAGGFAAFEFSATDSGARFAEDAKVVLDAQRWQLPTDLPNLASGTELRRHRQGQSVAAHLQSPQTLEVTSTAVRRPSNREAASIDMNPGARILGAARSEVSLLTDASIWLDGEVVLPGGRLALGTLAPEHELGFDPRQGVWVGSSARVDLGGTVHSYIDPQRGTLGTVSDGGVFEVDAVRGLVAVLAGAEVVADGAQGKLNALLGGMAPPADGSPVLVASDGGTIRLVGAEGLFVAGLLSAEAGGAGASGGTLELVLERRRQLENPYPSGLAIYPDDPVSVWLTETAAPLDWLTDTGIAPVDGAIGTGQLGVDQVRAGGFDRLWVRSDDTLYLGAGVDLEMGAALALDAERFVYQGATSDLAVRLSAPYLALSGVDSRSATSPAAAPTGGAPLEVHAQTLDLRGAFAVEGFSTTRLSSAGDLRLSGVRLQDSQRDYRGELAVQGDLELNAARLYPTTLSQFHVGLSSAEPTHLHITGGGPVAVPLSAGGQLSFAADQIVQDGALYAPLGTLELVATDSLTLGPDSYTGVAATGQTIPFGVTQAGLDWLYPLDGLNNLVFDAPPDKRLRMEGATIDLSAGAQLDVSGGGALYAWEFVPGRGGSTDYLLPGSASYGGGFAVLPESSWMIAPYDPLLSAEHPFAPDAQVYLQGVSGLADGRYAVLPARYALLPGGRLVTPLESGYAVQPFAPQREPSGAELVAGHPTDLSGHQAGNQWGRYRVETGALVRTKSEYSEVSAQSFYGGRAAEQALLPLLPRDGGAISLVADERLNLAGTLSARPESDGRGSSLDIAATKIRVVEEIDPERDALQLRGDQFSGLGIDSLLLGGARRFDDSTGRTRVDVTATELVFESGVQVQIPELIAVSSAELWVQTGAQIRASGRFTGRSQVLETEGDGVLMRVSATDQVGFARLYGDAELPGDSAQLMIDAGALLAAETSITLDSSGGATHAGLLQMPHGSLNLGASAIALGEPEANPQAGTLQFTAADLVGLGVDELVLTSRAPITIRGVLGLADDTGHLQPIAGLQRLVLDAPGLVSPAGASAVGGLAASQLRLTNSAGTAAVVDTPLMGEFELSAEELLVGPGDFRVEGIAALSLHAEDVLRFEGDARLSTAGDLRIDTPWVTAATGSTAGLEANGALDAVNTSDALLPGQDAALGGRLNIEAAAVRWNTQVRLPSGQLGLKATAFDLEVGDEAVLDVSGLVRQFADQFVATPGGELHLEADHGDLSLAPAAVLKLGAGAAPDLQVAEPGAPGRLVARASGGTLYLAGNLAGGGADLLLDAARLAEDQSLTEWVEVISSGGFSGNLALRLREQDQVRWGESASVTAESFVLEVDRGSLEVAGTLTVASDGQGRLALSAADQLILEDTATLRIAGGGDLQLTSVDLDADGEHGVSAGPGALIEFVDSAGRETGTWLRVERPQPGAPSETLPVTWSAPVLGSDRFTVEAVRRYGAEDLSVDGQLRATDLARFGADAADFMQQDRIADVEAALPGSARLAAGIWLDVPESLRIRDPIDTATWRYPGLGDGAESPGRVGHLSIRAGGNLYVDAEVSDGFEDGVIDLTDSLGFAWPIANLLRTDESWNFTLAGGADLAGFGAVRSAGAGDLSIGSGVQVRTGTGDLRLSAGRDLVLADESSVVYSAGQAAAGDRFGALGDLYGALVFYGEYPQRGGDLFLSAGRDLVGAPVDQLVTAWLLRMGDWRPSGSHSGETPTAWALALDPDSGVGFEQNVAAFGGGNLWIEAGRNIRDLSASVPTTGKPRGALAQPDQPFNFDFTTNEVEVGGGGALRVRAGADLLGGAYYLGSGTAELVAGGRIGGGSQFTVGPVLLLSDGDFSLRSAGDLSLTGVLDPFVLPQSVRPVGTSLWYSYAPGARLRVESITGDIALNSELRQVDDLFTGSFNSTQKTALGMYPPSVHARALGGELVVTGDLFLFPSSGGDLQLLSHGNLYGAANENRIGLSDGNLALIPSWQFPASLLSTEVVADLNPFSGRHAPIPVHQGDLTPARVVSAQGDIGGANTLRFSIPKATRMVAGQNLVNPWVQIQHTGLDDFSLLEAGENLRYRIGRSPSTGALLSNSATVEVAGPGTLLMRTGGDFDLGASKGVVSIGDTANPALADSGATLLIMPGVLSEYFDHAAFIEQQLGEDTAFTEARADVVDLLRSVLDAGELMSDAEVLAMANQLDLSTLYGIAAPLTKTLAEVLFGVLQEVGSAAAADPTRGNEAAFEAIETLFSDRPDHRADLSMFFSRVQTVDGGDVLALAPYGSINAGVAVSVAGSRPADELGIVAQREGAVRALVQNNFEVNQSRVFTLGGGNILIWASEGDIDAGRGAKSAISAPPPEVSFDENGNLVIEFPPIVSGSGIRTASSDPEVPPGDVYLFAPSGVVDAGEAGIGGTNVTIAAVEVIGADDIDIGGVSVGVPTGSGEALGADFAGASDLGAAAAKSVQDAASERSTQNAEDAATGALGILSVEVVSAGESEQACAPGDEACEQRRREAQEKVVRFR